MDDRFLHEARRDPPPAFARALRQRLVADDAAREERARARRRAARRGFFLLAPAAAAVLALVLFPQVRAGAQAFLELFRVRNFVAVNVDPERLKALDRDGVDPMSLLGEHVRTTPPEPTQMFDTPAAAFLAAGYVPREPSILPDGLRADTAAVMGAHEGELRLEASKVNELLASLGIHDVSLPPALDGTRIGVRMPRAVVVRYARYGEDGRRRRTVRFVQAPHPELSLPPGLERARLAEIGLRIAGFEADEARRFAGRIDWNSTILVPVPTGRCTFREVEVGGRKALLIERAPRQENGGPQPGADSQADGRVLLWSDEERIYALAGNLSDPDMLHMAGSLP